MPKIARMKISAQNTILKTAIFERNLTIID
jgi:hypothetical protein